MHTTVLLAEDQAMVREGIALLIRRHTDWALVAETDNGLDAVRLAEQLRPRVALLDVEMPGLNGIEAAARLKQVCPDTAVLALSNYGDALYRERMLAAGAGGYVLKNEAIDDLVQAVAAVLRGETFISPLIGGAEQGGPRRSTALDLAALTRRECDVLRLLALGERSKDIADALGISARTVETYRARIMAKLRIQSLAGLVRFALRAGLIEPTD